MGLISIWGFKATYLKLQICKFIIFEIDRTKKVRIQINSRELFFFFN